MDQVRLARGTLLAFVFACGEEVGAAQQIKIRLRMICGYVFYYLFNPDHWLGVGSFLLRADYNK
jgi:hypothetical protein